MKKKIPRIAWLGSIWGALLIGLIACQTQIPHTVSTPDTPSGPSTGRVGDTLTFVTGGAGCSQGHAVEYRFDWGDGTYSSWGPSASASKTYTSTGTYWVRAQARCAINTSVVSRWSSAVSVIIQSKDPCANVTGYTPVVYTWRYWLQKRELLHYIPNYLICRADHADVPRFGQFPYTGLLHLVFWPEDDQFLKDLAAAINSDLTDYYEIATNTLHFVQALMPYTPEVGDYWQLPVQTLRVKRGDCEDGAILYVALLKSLGFPVYFGVYPGHAFAFVEVHKSWVDWAESRPNKCRDLLGQWTIAIANGRYYAMAETTIDPSIKTLGYWGLGCGYIPPEYWATGQVRIFSCETGADVTALFTILAFPCSECPDIP